MTRPFVTCVCPTYARFPEFGHLVEEAVECFRQQDYPTALRELILINDCPEQRLVCDVPGVFVVNHPVRFGSLGEKYNFAIRQAAGGLVLPWEDDDLSLPWRISQAVKRVEPGWQLPDWSWSNGLDYWKPPQVWFCQNDAPDKMVWQHPVGVRHHAGVFTWSAWDRLGGYEVGNSSQDTPFDALLMTQARHAVPAPRADPWEDLPVEEWAYVYRWGVSPCHLSAHFPSTARAWNDWGSQEAARKTTAGTFHVKPRWRRDYLALTRAALPGRVALAPAGNLS